MPVTDKIRADMQQSQLRYAVMPHDDRVLLLPSIPFSTGFPLNPLRHGAMRTKPLCPRHLLPSVAPPPPAQSAPIRSRWPSRCCSSSRHNSSCSSSRPTRRRAGGLPWPSPAACGVWSARTTPTAAQGPLQETRCVLTWATARHTTAAPKHPIAPDMRSSSTGAPWKTK